MALHLEEQSPDILVLTETWLDIKLPNIHQDYGCMQSPLNEHQGVSIVYKKKSKCYTTSKKDWSTSILICKVGLGKGLKPIIIVGTYCQLLSKISAIKTLDRLITNLV